MNILFAYAESITAALGWTLLHSLWQGAVLAGVFALFSWLFRGARAPGRYWFGIVMLVLALVAPVMTFNAVYHSPAVPVAAALPPTAPEIAGLSTSSPGWQESLVTTLDWLAPWAAVAWMLGFMLMCRRLYRDWRQVRGLIIEGVLPVASRWQDFARKTCMAFGITRPVRVLESARVAGPMVLGWIKPVVLIPSSAFLGLTQQQLELLLAHEFAHVHRADYLVNLIQVAIEALLFYHPAVRWLSARIRHERECCCDELVVTMTGDRLAYATALTGMEELRHQGPALVMAASGGHLLARIGRLSGTPAPQRGAMHWLIGIVVLASGVGMLEQGSVMTAIPETPAVAASLAQLMMAEPVSRPTPDATPLVVPQPGAAPMEPVAVANIDAATKSSATNRSMTAITVAGQRQDFTGAGSGDVESTAPRAAVAPRTDAMPTAPVPAAKPVRQPDRGAVAKPADTARQSEPLPQKNPDTPATRVGHNEATGPVPRLASLGVDTGRTTMPVAPPIAPGNLWSGGELLVGKQPQFPRKARLRGIEGWVTVRYTIGRDGRVYNPRIVESKPGRTFDRAVYRALASWQFEPYALNGEIVEREVTRTIQFTMQPGSEILDGCAFATGTRLCKNVPEALMREGNVVQTGAQRTTTN